MSCGGVGLQFELCRSGAEAWAEKTGRHVSFVSTPVSSSERLALYQQLLAARAPDVDVLQIDVVWPGILGPHLLDLSAYVPTDDILAHVAAIVRNNTVEGRLVALPWYADAGVLYVRRDLLERYGRPVPETWDALAETARLVQAGERAAGDDHLWGYVWQGRAYEGLTCNALEWLASSGAGTIVDSDGRARVQDPRVEAAVERAASWVGTISPPGVLNYGEEEARGVFQLGHAVFMRNWPYAWGALEAPDSPVRGRVDIARLPKGSEEDEPAATLGGWQLAVSRYSRHPELAVDLIRFLTRPAEQRRRALAGAFLPTIEALYDDPELRASRPFLDTLHATVLAGVSRPSRVTGVKYNQVSAAFYRAVHAALERPGTARGQLTILDARLQHLSRGGRWR